MSFHQRVSPLVDSENPDVTFDAGLDNLTKDLAPVLVHFANGRTQKWTLIRLQDDSKGQGKAPANK